jgi:hypothetical protein
MEKSKKLMENIKINPKITKKTWRSKKEKPGLPKLMLYKVKSEMAQSAAIEPIKIQSSFLRAERPLVEKNFKDITRFNSF